MSNAEILSLISTFSYIVAAISLVLAIFLWFFFKIPSVIGDLSGRTAKKSIARMRSYNEKSGGQGYKPSAANLNRGKLTETMQQPRKTAESTAAKSAAVAGQKTESDSSLPATGVLASNRATLDDPQQTEMLDNSGITILLADEGATVPLHMDAVSHTKRAGGMKLSMLDEVILVHTDEVIA